VARKRSKRSGGRNTPPPSRPAAPAPDIPPRPAPKVVAEAARAEVHVEPDHPRARPDHRPDWWVLHLWQIQPIRDVLLIAAVVLLFQLGYALRIVTIPILVAMLLAYLFEPLVEKVTKRRWMSRQGAALTIITLAAVVIVAPLTLGLGFAAVQGTQLARSLSTNVGLVIQAAENWDDPQELESVKQRLPNEGWRTIADYFAELRADAVVPVDGTIDPDPTDAAGERAAAPDVGVSAAPNPWVFGRKPTSPPLPEVSPFPPPTAAEAEATTSEALRQERLREAKSAEFELMRYVASWIQDHANEIGQQALATGRGAVGIALGTATSLGVFLFQGFLTAFFFFFFSTGWGKVQEFWESLIPERKKGFIIDLLRKMDAVIAGFIRGRLLIGIVLAVYFTLAYWAIGVPAPLLLGPATGLMCLVPYLGFLSVPIAVITMWLSPSPWFAFQTTWWWMVFAPLVAYQIGQFFDDYVLTPQIQGKSTDMDVPSILFATIAGGAIAGIYGLLLAIPVAACIKILLREIFWPKFRRWATGQERDFLPIDRL
jgi:predicted PurR-regulated permease PerM